jgi:hypothetical protein
VCVERVFSELLLLANLGRWLGGGHRTLGWAAATPTASAEGRLRALKAIHAPLITSSTAPAGTVGGVGRETPGDGLPRRRLAPPLLPDILAPPETRM